MPCTSHTRAQVTCRFKPNPTASCRPQWNKVPSDPRAQAVTIHSYKGPSQPHPSPKPADSADTPELSPLSQPPPGPGPPALLQPWPMAWPGEPHSWHPAPHTAPTRAAAPATAASRAPAGCPSPWNVTVPLLTRRVHSLLWASA